MKVLLFKGRGIVSALIRWQTRSKWSHAAILLPDGVSIVESMQGVGVRTRTLDLKEWAGIDAFELPFMTSEQWAEVYQGALAEVGKGYDYWAVIRFIDRVRMPDNDRWFCSELVFEMFRRAGVTLLARIESWAVSPGILALSPKLIQFASCPTTH